MGAGDIDSRVLGMVDGVVVISCGITDGVEMEGWSGESLSRVEALDIEATMGCEGTRSESVRGSRLHESFCKAFSG